MAYNFTSATQDLSTSSAPVNGTPATLTAIVRKQSTGGNQIVMVLSNTGNNNEFSMYMNGFASYAWQQGVTTWGQASTSFMPNDTSTNMVAAYASNSSRKVYLNGVGSAIETTNTGASTFNRMVIGGFYGIAGINGLISEAAVWNVALTDDEITSLAKGFKPSRIRPQSLVFYAPLVRDLQDIRGALAITNTNSATVAVHPRVY